MLSRITSGSVIGYSLVLLMLMAGLQSQNLSASPTRVISRPLPPESCYRGDVADVVDLVDKAIALMRQQGNFVAFRQMMDPGGGFIKGDLYVFVLDQRGTIVANGDSPESAGANALSARDKNGHYFIKDILQKAFSKGGGWTSYHWYSPCTGTMPAKQVYFKRSGRFVVCVGFYDALAF